MIQRKDVQIFPIVKSMKLKNIKENSLASEYFLSKTVTEEMNKISII
jgi:hypothetical protein